MATNYIWDFDTGSYLEEVDDFGATTVAYTTEPVPSGKVISQKRGDETKSYHFDGSGSTRDLTDIRQIVTDEYEFGAFGERISSFGVTVNEFQFMAALGYTYQPESPRYTVRKGEFSPYTGFWLNRSVFLDIPGHQNDIPVGHLNDISDPRLSCNDFISWLMKNKNEKIVPPEIRKELECGVRIFCGDCRFPGAVSFPTFRGPCNICLPWYRWSGEESSPETIVIYRTIWLALLLHEAIHCQQFRESGSCRCVHRTPNFTPVPVPDLESHQSCIQCINWETPAYEAQAKYLFPGDDQTVKEYIAAGVCLSCSHIPNCMTTPCPNFPEWPPFATMKLTVD